MVLRVGVLLVSVVRIESDVVTETPSYPGVIDSISLALRPRKLVELVEGVARSEPHPRNPDGLLELEADRSDLVAVVRVPDVPANEGSHAVPELERVEGQVEVVEGVVEISRVLRILELTYVEAGSDAVVLQEGLVKIELGVRLPGKDDVERARQTIAEAKGPIMRTLAEIYARETMRLSEYPPKVEVILQAVRIGELGIVAIPCEVFAEIGLQIKRKSPLQPTFTIQLANGYNGYLPTPAQHELGGYETWRARSSYLEVGAAPTIVATLMDLLRDVSQR